MYRVLVPLDGSEFAEQALPFAEALGAHGAELALVQVVLATAEGRRVDELLHRRSHAAQDANQYLQRLERYYSGRWLTTQRLVQHGGAAEQLVETAATVGADLIVMCSHGRSGLSRWALGSVTDRVVRSAPCPVLIVRAVAPTQWSGKPPAFGRIVVPLDGSSLAETAVSALEPWYGGLVNEVVLVQVLDVAGSAGPAQQDAVAQSYLEGVAGRLRARGVTVTTVVRGGEPAEAIAAAAAAHGADAIALSSHGRSGLERWLLGSVAQRVIELSPLPVLVVRQGMAPAHPLHEQAAAQAAGRCFNCGRLVYQQAEVAGSDARCPRCGFHLHTCGNCHSFADGRCALGRPEVDDPEPGLRCDAFAWRTG